MRTALALMFALSSSIASADAIEGPPENCPSGARGTSSHYGPMCTPDPCNDDAECQAQGMFPRAPGRVCRPSQFCVLERTISHPRGDTQLVQFEGPCGADGSCAIGQCRAAKYCVDPDAPATPATDMRGADMQTDRQTDRQPDMQTDMGSTMGAMQATTTSTSDEADGCSAAPAPGGAAALLCLALLIRRRPE
jgi:hypothetical protein